MRGRGKKYLYHGRDYHRYRVVRPPRGVARGMRISETDGAGTVTIVQNQAARFGRGVTARKTQYLAHHV